MASKDPLYFANAEFPAQVTSAKEHRHLLATVFEPLCQSDVICLIHQSFNVCLEGEKRLAASKEKLSLARDRLRVSRSS